MPDDIIISELTNAPQIDDSAVFPLTQDNGGSPATFKATMSQVAGKVAEGTTYVNLETTAKTLVGAINEVNQSGGGGSADIISSASGSIATFTDGGNNIPVKRYECDINAVETGSGEKSPSNPYTISGWDSVDIAVSGINIWDEEWELCKYSTSTGEKTSSTNTIGSKNYIPTLPNTKYYYHLGDSGSLYAFYYDKNYQFINSKTVTNTEWTTPANTAFTTFYLSTAYGTTYNNDISINYPSTDTAYHAYTGNTTTITLPQTVYGGKLIFDNGWFVRVTHGVADLSSLSWSYASDAKRWRAIKSDMKNYQARSSDIIFEKYETDTDAAIGSDDKGYISGSYIYVHSTDSVTQPSGNACYPLATPTDIPISSLDRVKTISGTNNIYSNTGDVEVEYFNENADQLAELIKAMTR